MNMSTNVYQVVQQLFGQHSPAHAQWWGNLFPLTAAANVDVATQIKNINSRLRIVVGTVPCDTVHIRSCLVDNIAPNAWQKDLGAYVIPFIVNNVRV
jgi:hypothetical protein